MKEFWNNRFSGEEYIYGELPNEYLKERLAGLRAGKILFVAEGEGRNAVYAARLGWEVSAFDQSEEGKRKALLLAQKHNARLDYMITGMEDVEYPPASFDALVLIYAHFPAENRRRWHRKLAGFLKSGGTLILEGFEKSHTANQEKNPAAGGPRDVSMLYDMDELREDFEGFEFDECLIDHTVLAEGEHHKGEAFVARILATKV